MQRTGLSTDILILGMVKIFVSGFWAALTITEATYRSIYFNFGNTSSVIPVLHVFHCLFA